MSTITFYTAKRKNKKFLNNGRRSVSLCHISSFENNESETCDEPLTIRYAVAANNFFSGLQTVRLQRKSDFSFVVIYFSNDSGLTAESYALD